MAVVYDTTSIPEMANSSQVVSLKSALRASRVLNIL